MKIAVTYYNGLISKHLGSTEQYKIYETDGSKILNQDILETKDINPEELTGLLESIEADVLICGMVGDAIKEIFEDAGICLCSGIEGEADEMVGRYLNGELL